MAKKNKGNQPVKKSRFTDLIAFLALFLSVLLFLIGPILRKFAGDLGIQIADIASVVAEVLMVLALALPAWYFARKRGAFFKVLYVILLIIFVVGIVLGFTL